MPGLGRYVPGSSPLHGLDAGVKLAVSVLLAMATMVATRLAPQVVVLVLLVLGFAAARVPAGVLLRALRGALWLALFVGLANIGWGLVVRWTGWTGGEGAIGPPAELGILLARLVNLLVLAALFTSTTVPVDAAEGIERLLRPLRRLRVPVHELGFLLVLALSFVPILWREARRLADAHRVKVGRARWRAIDRARAAVPLLVPLFLGALRRADDLAVALDARGFVPGAPRTSLVASRVGPTELAALGMAAATLVGCWLVR